MKQNRYITIILGFAACLLCMTNTTPAMDPPIAHWTMDEADGQVAHDMAGDRDGTWVGNISWQPTAGRYGGAIACEDDSSFIVVDDSDLSFFEVLGTTFTVSVWISVFEFSQDWQGIVFKNDKFFLERNNSASNGTANAIHFKVKDETGAQPFNLYGNITIDDGEWHHIVGIYDDFAAYLYIDGVLDVEGTGSGAMVGLIADPLLIGAKYEVTYRNSWNGLIDDVKFFNYAMSAEQVDSLYALEITGIREKYETQPRQFFLAANYPNPFNPTTTISFDMPRDAFVTLKIVNVNGRVIRTLVNEEKTAGSHAVNWDGRDDSGKYMTSGLYFYQMTADNFSQTGKMVLAR